MVIRVDVIGIDRARSRIAELIDKVQAGPVMVTRNGEPAAVILAPEDYEFPACEPCNRKSRDHEHVLTMLVRLKAEGPQNEQRDVDFAKYAKAMRNNFPGLLRVLGPDEKRGVNRRPTLGRLFTAELAIKRMTTA